MGAWNDLLTRDVVATKCGRCQSAVAGSVTRRELASGAAELQCKVCGANVRLSPPLPLWRSLPRESGSFLRLAWRALRQMGPVRVVVLGGLWATGWYVASHHWGWGPRAAQNVPGIPFFLVFLSALWPLAKQSLRDELGAIRAPPSTQGLTQKDAVKVGSILEEYRFLASRQCPRCGGPFKTGIHAVVFSRRLADLLRLKLRHEVTKLFDQIDVTCRQCGHTYAYAFDIDGIEYVASLGYSQQMIRHHMQQIALFHQHTNG